MTHSGEVCIITAARQPTPVFLLELTTMSSALTQITLKAPHVCLSLFISLGPTFPCRSVGPGEQRWQVHPHRPHGLDAAGGLHQGFGCEPDRCD